MLSLFIHLGLIDILDILLVSYLMYRLYLLIRGTVALNIFWVVLAFYIGWLLVRSLNMVLLGTIFDKVISVGLIAIIILFQQEIRRFLLFVGTRYFSRTLSFEKLSLSAQEQSSVKTQQILEAVIHMAETQTGALIVIIRKSDLDFYAQAGQTINADCSAKLLEALFFKNSPMHDGAVLVKNEKIVAAKCVLPLSDNLNLPPQYGLRHRAALGITEHTDALAIVVSEETGNVAISDHGMLTENISSEDLKLVLEREFAVD
jgi:uncharacterized protein (TIGR00159 family)